MSLAQIFADLGAPNRAAAPISGAVDVRTIVPAKPEPEPAPVAAKPEEAKVETAKGARKPGEAKLAVAAQADAKKAGAKGKPNDDKAAAEDEDAATGKKGAKGKSAKTAEAKKADAKKAEAKKAPSHPSRIWVQIGVGRDMGAIAYDWRRYVKDNPALFKARQASTSEMGRTNRILIGPFETQKAAAAFVAQAKKADFDGAYVWTSPAGQAVDPLSAK